MKPNEPPQNARGATSAELTPATVNAPERSDDTSSAVGAEHQTPVAWMVADEGWNQCFTTKEQADTYGRNLIPLYAHPAPAAEQRGAEQANDSAITALREGGLHPATACLVWNFALALANKLHDAEQKYGYSDGWRSKDWMDECRAKLRGHIDKGDPRDVAAYCAFLWHHGESTAAAPPAAAAGEDAKDAARYRWLQQMASHVGWSADPWLARGSDAIDAALKQSQQPAQEKQ